MDRRGLEKALLETHASDRFHSECHRKTKRIKLTRPRDYVGGCAFQKLTILLPCVKISTQFSSTICRAHSDLRMIKDTFGAKVSKQESSVDIPTTVMATTVHHSCMQ